VEVAEHEEAGEAVEAGGEERAVEGAGGEHEELGFDAADAGCVLEELDEVVEEGFADGVAGGGGLVEGVDVADDGLIGLVDAEGVALEDAVAEGDEAGEDATVEVFEEHLGGAGVVPVKALLPMVGLVAEQGAELRRGEVAEVEDLELGWERQEEGLLSQGGGGGLPLIALSAAR
jgi:hypothetical protein